MLCCAGFLSVLHKAVDELTVVKLTVSSAVGGAVLGARAAGFDLPIDYHGNTTLLEHYKLHNSNQDSPP